MKKRITCILSLALLLGALSACNKGGTTPSDQSTDTGSSNEVQSTNSEQIAATTPEEQTTEEPTTEEQTTDKQTEPPVVLGDPVELINNNAGEEDWAVIKGVWSGTLASGAGGLEPVERFINDEGYLELTSPSTSTVNTADHGIGNYIGVADLLQPNTTYTVEAKFFTNSEHALHATYPITYEYVYIRYSANVASGDPVAICDSEDFETYTYTFTTGSNVAEDAYLQVGPIGVGSNVNWGAFCPGASLVIKSCILQAHQ